MNFTRKGRNYWDIIFWIVDNTINYIILTGISAARCSQYLRFVVVAGGFVVTAGVVVPLVGLDTLGEVTSAVVAAVVTGGLVVGFSVVKHDLRTLSLIVLFKH